MEIKQTSLSKKIVFIIAFVLLTLNIIFYITIIGLNKSTLYDMEREKAQLITKTYAPILAMQIYLDMTDKIEKIAKQMLINKSILEVTISFTNKTIYSNNKTKENDGIKVVENIYEPGSNNKIGTIAITYSVANYEAVLKRNIKIISIFLVLFIFVFIGFSWYIQKQLNPLYKLSILLGKYKPENNIKFPYTEKNDEIGMIAKALTKMHSRIQIEQKKRHQNEQMLVQQSRLAQMGEMISMIAHQWRQPLNAISATANNLQFELMMDNVDNDSFQKEVELINQYSQHLSKTIDDFRGFFKENKEQEITTLDNIINSTLTIVNTSIESKNIKIITDLNCNIEFKTYPSEIKQVVLNIIKNAEDILIENKIKNATITIETLFDNKTKITLIIKDNAGGIPSEIIEKIFDPYFSTKLEKDGTGLGLYMSKTIIEDHCGGTLTVSNNTNGAVFKIEFKNTEISLTK